jgi:hypothetical protein
MKDRVKRALADPVEDPLMKMMREDPFYHRYLAERLVWYCRQRGLRPPEAFLSSLGVDVQSLRESADHLVACDRGGSWNKGHELIHVTQPFT